MGGTASFADSPGTAVMVCAKPLSRGNREYYFVATNINLPYWAEAEAGFLDAAKNLKVRAETDGSGDV